MKLTKARLQSIVVHGPKPSTKLKQHMCMDKGYDFPGVYELLEDYGYTTHIRLRLTRGRRSKNQEKEFRHVDPSIG